MKKSTGIIIGVVLIVVIGVCVFLFKDSIFEEKDGVPFSLENKYYKKSSLIDIETDDIDELVKDKETFAVYVHIPGMCNNAIPFEPLLQEILDKYEVSFYSLSFETIEGTLVGEYVKYSPSIVIFKDGKVVDYLDAESDEDTDYYKSTEELEKWITSYIKTK